MINVAKVVAAGRFSRAADMPALPKARASRRSCGLERHLTVRLLERTTRGLTLTEDGRAHFAKCQLRVQDIQALEGALRGGTVAPRGRLRAGSGVPVARWVIAPHVHALRARDPHIAVRGQVVQTHIFMALGGDCVASTPGRGPLAQAICSASPGAGARGGARASAAPAARAAWP